MNRRRQQRVNRILDVAIVGMTSPAWGLLLALTATLSRLTQGKQVFFTHHRAGVNAKLFNLLKFRTMIRNADEYLDENGRPTRERVTTLGRTLRRSGLDELPQFLNVLKGDMSLVGPRPVLPEWVDRVPGQASHPRFSVLPGLTGPAQLAGRNAVKWSERLALDAHWAENPSGLRYLKIVALTPLALLKPTVAPDRNQGEVDDLQHLPGDDNAHAVS